MCVKVIYTYNNICNYPPPILKSSGDIVLALSVRPSVLPSEIRFRTVSQQLMIGFQ